ncbi:hypothetical protein [Halobellus rubicundus]|uniref:Uncharacterized protein n=1 Tax=Halobellus rubicundus TaxID=2996466 RepID=A0ABD5MBS1_9EURY
MKPRTAFWAALLAYGVLSVVSVADSIRSGGPGAIGVAVGGVLVVASAGYALRRPERAGGPEEWNLVAIAAVAGAVLYALGLLVGVA